MDKDLIHTLSQFESISLDEIQEIKLMNRIDRKFLLTENQLRSFWRHLPYDYRIFQIEDNRLLKYKTVYYDTEADDMYKAHHNGKLNRLKVRHRTYENTNEGFLELKLKTNKGRTIKRRVQSAPYSLMLTPEDRHYIRTNSVLKPKDLKVKLINHFSRVTLVNTSKTERCTIDFSISFEKGKELESINKMVVIEIKSEKGNSPSLLAEYVHKLGVKETSFSKYCMGRVLLEPMLKMNRFKSRMRRMERMLKEVS